MCYQFFHLDLLFEECLVFKFSGEFTRMGRLFAHTLLNLMTVDIKKKSDQSERSLVAGTGLEPVTFGL